jgi:quercetin dioxygenase-like cupin family protein
LSPSALPAPIDFAALPWQSPAPGVRFKAVVRGGLKLRLLEFSPGFVEPDWCRKGHVGWVLEGTLRIEFPGGTETFRAGQGVFLLAGEAERHKAHVVGDAVRLILVEAE